MHELSICQSLLEQVDALARQHQAQAVALIKVQLGPLAGVEAELLQHAFSIARAGTVAAQAELRIERLPVRVRCSSCGAETEVAPNHLVCGQCGDWQTQVVSGDEMLLASLELLT